MRAVPITQYVMSFSWDLKKRAVVKQYYLWTVLQCLPDSNVQAVRLQPGSTEPGAARTGCHL